MTGHEIRNARNAWARRLSRWLFGDVMYAVLPILVLAGITLVRKESFHSFAEIQEWSFATIVLLGVTIRKFVRLKVEIQQSPTSYKLDAGIQTFVVCLVASVVVLSFVILKEKKLVEADDAILGAAQLTLFAVGALSLLVAVYAEDVAESWQTEPNARVWQLTKMNSKLLEAELAIEEVLAVDKPVAAAQANATDSKAINEEARLNEILAGTLVRLRRLIDQTNPPPAAPSAS
jgi:hypothetical protein